MNLKSAKNTLSILVVDTKPDTAKWLKKKLAGIGQTFRASNKHEAFELLDKEDVQVICVSHRMPEIHAVSLLTDVNKCYPQLVSLLYLDEHDPEVLIAAINEAQVFRVVGKSTPADEWDVILKDAFKKSNRLDAPFTTNDEVLSEIHSVSDTSPKEFSALQHFVEEKNKYINMIDAIYNSTPGFLYLFDEEERLVRWNSKVSSISGYTDEELHHMSLMEWFKDDPQSQQIIRKATLVLDETNYVEVEADLQLKNGTKIPMLFTVSPVLLGGNMYFTGIGLDLTEQKRVQQNLIKSKEVYRDLFANMHTAFATHEVILNKNGHVVDYRFLEVNPAFEKMTGLKKADIIGKTCLDVLPETESYWLERYGKVALTGEPISFENYSQNLNRHYHVNAYSSEYLKFSVLFIDISERKKMEIALKNSERQLTTLIQNLPGFIYKCANDKDWTMFYVSDACKRITGYDPDDFINNKVLAYNDIIHPDFKKHIYNEWDRILEQHDVFEYEYQIVTASGEIRWMWEQGRGIFDTQGNLSHLEGIILDVTARVQAQEALKYSETKFRTLFSKTNDLMLILKLMYDNLGNISHFAIQDCNEAFENAFLVKKDDICGKTPTEVMGYDSMPYVAQIIDAVLQDGTFNYISNLSILDKQFHTTAVSLQNGTFAMLATDITELQNLNNVLMEKNKELESYVYITSHDLRSPLVNIQGFSSRLQKQTDEIGKILENCPVKSEQNAQLAKNIKEKIPHTLEFIFNNVEKMDAMLGGLLKLSRTGRVSMNIEIIDMNKLLNNVLQSLDFQIQEIDALIELDTLPDCFGDADLLNQLFTNLINNAIKYRGERMRLKICISGIKRFRKVQYRIKDNGIGISKKNQTKIWDVFYRVDNKSRPGDGVGLSVVKRIVDKHQGKIWVESTEQVGTVFYIEIPDDVFEDTV